MKSDIVERLRSDANRAIPAVNPPGSHVVVVLGEWLSEAADEIERLRLRVGTLLLICKSWELSSDADDAVIKELRAEVRAMLAALDRSAEVDAHRLKQLLAMREVTE